MLSRVIAPRTLRSWLRRLNVALVVLLVWVSVDAAVGNWGPKPAPWRPVSDVRPTARDWHAAHRGPSVSLEEYLRLIRRIHPSPAPQRQSPESPAAETRLPLRAFRVAMLIHGEGDPAGILLKSKDPSRTESYVLYEGSPSRGAVLEHVSYEGETAWCFVRRGEESFSFAHPLKSRRRAVGVHLLGNPPAPRLDRGARVRGASAPVLTNLLPSSIKGVPFFGGRGEVIGFRVSGVKPGSRFQEMGLQAGDVICRVDYTPIDDMHAFRGKLATGFDPDTLVVQRRLGAESTTITLADG